MGEQHDWPGESCRLHLVSALQATFLHDEIMLAAAAAGPTTEAVVAPLLAFLQQAFNQEGRVRRSQQQQHAQMPGTACCMIPAAGGAVHEVQLVALHEPDDQ
jgi:hypothetical protein